MMGVEEIDERGDVNDLNDPIELILSLQRRQLFNIHWFEGCTGYRFRTALPKDLIIEVVDLFSISTTLASVMPFSTISTPGRCSGALQKSVESVA